MNAWKRTTDKVGPTLAALAVAGLAVVHPEVGLGQQNPAEVGSGRKPYVTIVLDTSASMEWSDEGDSTFPERQYNVFGFGDPLPNQPSEYVPKMDMGVGNGGDAYDAGLLTSGTSLSSNPLALGSCMVWEPVCSSYERPSWNPDSTWTSHYASGTNMGDRFQTLMRGEKSVFNNLLNGATISGDTRKFPLRLLNTSQPRHVTFKEVLTGEMILQPSDSTKPVQDENHLRYGPGCWAVPRQFNPTNPNNVCTANPTDFKKFPDHLDPRPHFQEVFDGQKSNGLLDSLKYEMFFAVAAFDSYQYPQTGSSYGSSGDNDDLGTVDWGPNNLDDSTTGSFQKIDEGGADPYNMGVYRIVGPTRFDVPKRYMPNLSKYAQYALLDNGTLKLDADPNSSSSAKFTLDPTNPPSQVDFQQQAGLDDYLLYDENGNKVEQPFVLSRQPIGRFTPLAPAMYDIQHAFNQSSHPVNTDKFKACRPKHVILMTDGKPLPESTSGSGCTGSTEGLSGNFKIDPNEYPYACTEEHISRFVTGDQGGNYMVNSASGPDMRYDPRVHVVGLNVRGDDRQETIDKLASMARAGKTCAGFFLKDSSGAGKWIPDSNGDCRQDDHPCLVSQPENYEFVSFQDPNVKSTCEYPALILQCNGDSKSIASMTATERAAYSKCRSGSHFATALQQIFNQILKSTGLASRTKPAMTSQLDDPDSSVGGQYRLYSGVKVDGNNPYWRGVMFREKRLCSSGGTSVDTATDGFSDPCSSNYFECFHKQVADLVTNRNIDGVAQEDNRRVFTSVPSTDVWDYANTISKPHGTSACGRFHSTYMMEASGTLGEFQDSYLELNGGSTSDLLNNHRVPLETTTLSAAFVGDGTDSSKPLVGLQGTNLPSYFNTADLTDLKGLINQVRGRVKQRSDRVLGGILNSNPVVVEPPSKDIPIESYKAYKARFAERPTMTYFSTIDGMIHAVHTGEMDGGNKKVMVRDGMTPSGAGTNISGKESTGVADAQREAWAYVPNLLLDDLSQYRNVNPYLIDGTPVVKDVRLCHANNKYNQNFQACRSVCSSSDDPATLCSSTSSGSCVPPEMQWRSVLVQGMGQAGSGYFALDVTRPGGPYPNSSGGQDIQRPDPIPLWEFDSNWERGQIKHMVSSSFPEDGEALVYPPSSWRSSNTSSLATNCSDTETDSNYYWKQPFLGESVGEPAIGTVVLPGLGSDANIQRPVAVFTAGAAGPYGTKCDRAKRSGKAIYVVDLQTGSLLRRFVGYQTTNGWTNFDDPVVGTPALYDNSTGSLVTRGFVGDSSGKLYRMDFSDPDPAKWEVTLFFDPTNTKRGNSLLSSGFSKVGPAAMKPAVALGPGDNLVVIYGLGETGDTTNKGEEQMVIGVSENTDAIQKRTQGKRLWHLNQSSQGDSFRQTEKLTGAPIIFNRKVYFTSYYLRKGNLCSTGRSRIWGMEFDTDTSSGNLPAGAFDCANNSSLGGLNNCGSRWFEPKEDVLIRGLTITLGPSCSVSGSSRSTAKINEQDDRKPQLVAQTGGSDPGSGLKGSSPSNGSASDFVNRLEVGIDAPRSQTIPMSWTVISQ